MRFVKGMKPHNWGGGIRVRQDGYRTLFMPGHPRAGRQGYVMEHIVVVERAMGKHLRLGVEVHHVNGIRADNRNRNLVACDGQGYHRLLHLRAAALVATGDPDKRKCGFCGRWDEQAKLFVKKRSGFYHRSCKTEYQRERRWQAGVRPLPAERRRERARVAAQARWAKQKRAGELGLGIETEEERDG